MYNPHPSINASIHPYMTHEMHAWVDKNGQVNLNDCIIFPAQSHQPIPTPSRHTHETYHRTTPYPRYDGTKISNQNVSIYLQIYLQILSDGLSSSVMALQKIFVNKSSSWKCCCLWSTSSTTRTSSQLGRKWDCNETRPQNHALFLILEGDIIHYNGYPGDGNAVQWQKYSSNWVDNDCLLPS